MPKKLKTTILHVCRMISLLLLLGALLAAQTQSAPNKISPPPSINQGTGPPGSGNQKSDIGDAVGTKISPKEAEQLFRDIDEILKFASKDTNLPIKHEVKRKLTTRDEVVAYLEKTMAEDNDAQRLRRSESVLKKFGLLPPDFNLQDFLVKLLREQVAGYYDPKTETVNLLDWIGPEQQRPVMAHELTHALQDQSFGLEKWMKAGDVNLDEKKNLTPEDLEKDELSEARQAVVEGQAMIVLVDYMLAPTGQSLLSSPQLANAMKEGMLVGTDDSPAFQNAPLFLKEALTFPYRYGIDFEAELLRSGGKDKAFAGALGDPPHSTRQIMEPKTYLSHEQLQPMRLPDFSEDFKNYDRFDVGAMGEFDVAILVDQYAGPDVSRDIYPHWRGGYYYAGRPKGDASAPLALLYVSRWSNAESAASFAAIYAKALAKRYNYIHQTEDASRALDLQNVETLTGSHTWLTEQGPVVITVQNDTALITESLDQPTTDRLERELLGLKAAAVNR
ncbi:MAG TPA: hypothetical protein VEI26_00705 [Terriglobales bacterium]|nr:hypothetical protein [Terriglobales bacterium]